MKLLLIFQLAMEIDIAYKGKSEEVMTKFNASNSAHQRAERLLTRASNLASSLSTNYKSLQCKYAQQLLSRSSSPAGQILCAM